MKLNAPNMLRQAARAIDPRKDDGAYVWALEQLAEHLEDVREGRHTFEEFAQAYCLTKQGREAA